MNKKRRRALMAMLTTVLFLLAACGNATDESVDHTDSQSTDQNKNEDSSNKTALPTKEQDNHQQKEQDGSSNHTTPDSEENDSQKSNSGENDTHVSKKEEYLKKLQDTKNKTDNLKPTDSSTYALKKVEDDRWDMWDALLNEIYGALKDQLSAEDMKQLQEEQRRWIQDRDEKALKASQKYKGGTQEQLEYSAVAANLTEERCFELVENYMK